MDGIFVQLAIILAVAFVVSYIIRIFKQPIVIGYIIAGIIISPFLFRLGQSTEVIETFSHIGIAFLLFIVGLHLNPKVIKEIGTKALVIGLAQIGITFGLGFLVSNLLLNFSVNASVYVGIALAFSSTIIIMKVLSDKRQLDSLYGKMAIGVLIVQDLVAALALMMISSMGEGLTITSFAIQGLLIGGGLIAATFLIGFLVLPRVMHGVAKNQELLFLFSICWCFVIATIFGFFGFSMEIGALLAGMVLSISPYSTEISSKIRPLRDFFLVIFFIILGVNIKLDNVATIIVDAAILSAVVLIFKPLILMTLMAMFKYTKRTNFFVGTSLAQISEFSLIVLTMGVAMGHIGVEILYTLTLTLVITILFSTYMMIYSNKFYLKMNWLASFFEKKNIKKERKIKKSYDAILFGYNRVGFNILNSLKKIKKKYLVVDFDPETINNLKKFSVPCLYGDVDDQELLNDLPLDKVELVVSTVPDYEVNYLLVESVRLVNQDAIVIARANEIQDAIDLYNKGANYVLTPHFIGGDYLSRMIKEDKLNKKKYDEEKDRHMQLLHEIQLKSKGRLRILPDSKKGRGEK